MGNCLQSVGLCSCFVPKYEDDHDFTSYHSNKLANSKNIEARRSVRRAHSQIYAGDHMNTNNNNQNGSIFTIFNNDISSNANKSLTLLDASTYTLSQTKLKQSTSIKSLFDHKLLTEIADLNLLEMSRQLYHSTKQQFEQEETISYDSGYGASRRTSVVPSIHIKMDQLDALNETINLNNLVYDNQRSASLNNSIIIQQQQTNSNSAFALSLTERLFNIISTSSPNILKTYFSEWSKTSIKILKHSMFKYMFISKIKENLTMNSSITEASLNSTSQSLDLSALSTATSTSKKSLFLTNNSSKSQPRLTIRSLFQSHKNNKSSKAKRQVEETCAANASTITILNDLDNTLSLNVINNLEATLDFTVREYTSSFYRLTPVRKFLLRLYDVNFF